MRGGRSAVLLAGALLMLAAAGPGAPPRTTIDPAQLVEAPTVTAAASAQQVALGQVFYLFVRVVYRPGVQVNLPASLPLGGAFEETARTDAVTRNPDGTLSRDFEIVLQAFEVGDLVIPPVPVTYAAHGHAEEIQTHAVPIQVTSFVGDGEAHLEDIAGPVAVQRRDWTLLYVVGALAGLALLVAGALAARRAWRRRRRRELARLPEALVRSAHEEAMAKLAEVEASGALDGEDRKPVYLAMSEILRGYVGRRYGFPALDLTTGEIARYLLARPDAAAYAGLITAWLERADLVKFAGWDASPDDARRALYEARLFVERTRQATGADAAPTPAMAPAPAAVPAPAPAPAAVPAPAPEDPE